MLVQYAFRDSSSSWFCPFLGLLGLVTTSGKLNIVTNWETL